MKNYLLFTSGFILIMIMVFSSCKSKSTQDPCNNMGKLCIENKMDSTVVVSIIQKHQQVTLQKDFMECFDLDANLPYTISISGSSYTKPDTTLMILPCDNKLIVVQQ
jgi:hypothetical protein